MPSRHHGRFHVSPFLLVRSIRQRTTGTSGPIDDILDFDNDVDMMDDTHGGMANSAPIPGDIIAFQESQGVVPLDLSSENIARAGDGSTFFSVYLLNKEYEFMGAKRTRSRIPDCAMVCSSPNINAFLDKFNYLTVGRLGELAKTHIVPSSTRRAGLMASL